MIGAYLAFSFTQATGNLWLAIALAVPLVAAIGLVLEWLLIRPLYGRDPLHQVLLTYGLILVFEESRSLLFGDDVHGVRVPEFLNFSIPLTDALSYPVYRLAMSAICLALAFGMYLVIQRTRLGMAIRADDGTVYVIEEADTLYPQLYKDRFDGLRLTVKGRELKRSGRTVWLLPESLEPAT